MLKLNDLFNQKKEVFIYMKEKMIQSVLTSRNLFVTMGILTIWQLLFLVSPSSVARFTAMVFLSLHFIILLIAFFLKRHSKKIPYQSFMVFLGLLFLFVEFILTYPFQTSDWIFISDQSFTLSQHELETCQVSSYFKNDYAFSCTINEESIRLVFPKALTTLSKEGNVAVFERFDQYQYSLIEVWANQLEMQEETLFKQTQFHISFPETLELTFE